MFNLIDITNENNEDHNKKWSYVPDHPCRMLIIGGSGSGKTNALLNLIKEQDSGNLNDKIYLYAKGLHQPKYQFLIKKREDIGTKHDPKGFIEYSNTMNDVYNNIDDYNPNRKRKILTILRLIKKSQAITKELLIRCRKLNIPLLLMTQSYFSLSKEVRLNSIHYLIMRIYNKRELQKNCYQSFSRH